MKSIRCITAVALTLTALILVYAQTRQTVSITTQTLTAHSTSNPLLVDLTRDGKIYNVAAGLDYSRLRFRTERGDRAMSDYVRKLGLTGISFLMGTESDLSAINFGVTGGTITPPDRGTATPVKCANDLCICIAGTDCKDMSKAKVCINGTWSCYKPTGKPMQCSCIAKTALN